MLAFQPEQLPPLPPSAGTSPVVFNCSHTGAGPVMNLMMVHRLLRREIHPDWLFVEILPPFLSYDGAGLFLGVMQPGDMPILRNYFPAWGLYRKYCRVRFFSRRAYQPELLRLALPTLFGTKPTASFSIGRLGGPVNVMAPVSPGEILQQTAIARGQYPGILSHFQVTPWADHATRSLLELCRQQHIGVSLMLMPEGSEFRSWYPPQALEQLDAYLASLRRSYGVDVIDARSWLADEDFYDSHHVLRSGAERFTRRFGSEVLQPLVRHGLQPFPESRGMNPPKLLH
jgi:hypothetical protein